MTMMDDMSPYIIVACSVKDSLAFPTIDIARKKIVLNLATFFFSFLPRVQNWNREEC